MCFQEEKLHFLIKNGTKNMIEDVLISGFDFPSG